MRNMSFMLTTNQIREAKKTVTRRMGWEFLKPGDRLMAVEKCQGLKKGEEVNRIREIVVRDVRREKLADIDDADTMREGFPGMGRVGFIEMFCAVNKCQPHDIVTRIEFLYPGYSYSGHHVPSGEDWHIVGIDIVNNRVVPAGWPRTLARLSDISDLWPTAPIEEEEIDFRKKVCRGGYWI